MSLKLKPVKEKVIFVVFFIMTLNVHKIIYFGMKHNMTLKDT